MIYTNLILNPSDCMVTMEIKNELTGKTNDKETQSVSWVQTRKNLYCAQTKGPTCANANLSPSFCHLVVAAVVNGRMVLGLSVSGTNFDDFGRNWTLQVDEDRLGDAGVALEPPCGHQLI